MQAFTLACEFMYTGGIEELEDAEVAINVWMVGAALEIHGLTRYVHRRSAHTLVEFFYAVPNKQMQQMCVVV